jgi:GGDEF domain-containing protein
MQLSRRGPNPRWALWSLPRRVLLVILTVELVALATLALQVAHLPPVLLPHWGWTLAVLIGAGVVSTEASLGVERRRHRPDRSPHIDLSSVWTFAAAALLPGALAAVVVVVLYGHLYARAWRPMGVPPHRVAFSGAAIVLAVLAAGAVIGTVDPAQRFHTELGLLAVALALVVYAVVNMLLVVVVMVLSEKTWNMATFLQVLGRVDEAVLEFATLSMGALAAGAMAAFGPVYAVFVLPTLIVLHRSVLVHQLEEEASTDGKTGLLNAAAWHLHADRALRRSERSDTQATVLVLEDLVGRFGGEEFVVLLMGLDGAHDPAAARAVAERIRKRIEQLQVRVGEPAREVVVEDLTVSIGGATFPADGSELVQLVEGADTAMYAAKRAGRNKVRMGVEPVPDATSLPLP